METKVLEQEELQQVKDVQQERLILTDQFGVIEYNIQDLEQQKSQLISRLAVLKQKEIELGKMLQEKYGDGTINLEKGEWRVGPEIPKDRLRGSAGCVVYKNKIYTVCGITDGHWDGHVAWLDEYDPKTNTWVKLADAPHLRDHVSVAVINDKLYVAGGRRSTARINQVLNLTEAAVDVYDLKKKTWQTLPSELNLPTQRAGNSSVAFGDKLLVIGGESAAQVPAHSEVEAFDTKKMQWVPFPSLKQGRHGTGASVVGGKVYSVAGSANRGGGPEINEMEVLK